MLDVDAVGKLLFGNPTRLRLCLWILERDKTFYQSEPPTDVGVTNAIRQSLTRLVALGMLAEYHPDGSLRINYETTDSPLWSIIQAVRDLLP